MIGTGSFFLFCSPTDRSWVMGKECFASYFCGFAIIFTFVCFVASRSPRAGKVAYQVQIAVRRFYKSFAQQSSTNRGSHDRNNFLVSTNGGGVKKIINFHEKLSRNQVSMQGDLSLSPTESDFKGNFGVCINTTIDSTWKSSPGCKQK